MVPRFPGSCTLSKAKHGDDAQGAGGHHDVAGQLRIAAHLLGHGEGGDGRGAGKHADKTGKARVPDAQQVGRCQQDAGHDDQTDKGHQQDVPPVPLQAAEAEESAQQEQQQGTGHVGYLIHRRFQRGGQSPVHSQKQQTHRGAYDQRVGEDHPQEPGGAQLFAPEHRQGDDGQHVEQGHDHRGQHRHGSHVRAGHQRLGQRQSDDRQIAAVHALDLHALLFGILFRGQRWNSLQSK